MSSGADVGSVDSLRQFRAALCDIAEQVQAALAEAESELARTADWLHHTQQLHWKNQVLVRTDEYSRARSALNRKRAEKSPTGGRQSTVEEEQVFRVAERRLEEARTRVAAVKRWTRKLEEVALEYRPVAQGLQSLVQLDVPRALARIDHMLAALEAYLAGGPAPAWVTSAAPGEMMRRALDDSAAEPPDEPPGTPENQA